MAESEQMDYQADVDASTEAELSELGNCYLGHHP